jgi:hypothetical protein
MRLQEAAVPAEQPGATALDIGADDEPALEVQGDLFSEIATYDEFAEYDEPTIEEPAPVVTEGAVTETTVAAPAVSPVASAPESLVPPAQVPPQTAAVTPPTAPAVAVPSPEQHVPASAAAPDTQPATGYPEPVDFEKHRATILPKLEELYKLTDDEAEEVRADPSIALPKLAARLHFETTQAALNSVLGVLPGIIEQINHTQKAYAENEDRFYGRWADLKKPEYQETVMSSVRAYKAANPRATQQEVIERAGLMAMLTLGLNPQQQAVIQQQTIVPPATRQVPPVPAGVGASSRPFAAPRGNQEMDDIASLVEAEIQGLL